MVDYVYDRLLLFGVAMTLLILLAIAVAFFILWREIRKTQSRQGFAIEPHGETEPIARPRRGTPIRP